MKAIFNSEARKHSASQPLDEELVVQARGLTDKLSGEIESPLAGCLGHERQQHLAKANAVEASVSMWIAFNAKHGSFADEHSTL